MVERNSQQSNRGTAVYFVLCAFAFWFLFTGLAKVVITCAPSIGCTWDQLHTVTLTNTASPGAPNALRIRDLVVLSMTLLTALWAASRIFFPPEKFDR